MARAFESVRQSSSERAGSAFRNKPVLDVPAERLTGNTLIDVNETLTGGTGSDSVVFDSALIARTNVDTILDFKTSEGDKLLLKKDGVFGNGIGDLGMLAPGAFRVGGKVSVDADDRIIYDPTDGSLYYDPNGFFKGSAGTATLFAKFRINASNLAPELTYEHFFII
ncbi:hypothetical protein AB4Y85_16535 [Microvirga sp. 2YAF29]|uniref:hypothetical protein n=1 Tax=Microvirga sp. 2YAF29 TaxID=3233031 RepID=UPI003F9D263A